MDEGKLVFLPKGYRVVPEEPTIEMIESSYSLSGYPSHTDKYRALLKAAPPIDTPPVLRWEGDVLMLFSFPIAYVHHLSSGGVIWHLNTPTPQHMENAMDSILARRAAEKALGFPDGLIIEEV